MRSVQLEEAVAAMNGSGARHTASQLARCAAQGRRRRARGHRIDEMGWRHVQGTAVALEAACPRKEFFFLQ